MENLLVLTVILSGAAFWNTIQISKQVEKIGKFLTEKLGAPNHIEDYK